MKRAWHLASIVLVAFAALALSSCDWLAGLFEPLIGTWAVTAETVDGTPLAVPGDVSMTMIVKSDNTLTASGTAMGAPTTGTGTWSKNGSAYSMIVTSTFTGGSNIATLSGTLDSEKDTFTGAGTAVNNPGGSTSTVDLLVLEKQ